MWNHVTMSKFTYVNIAFLLSVNNRIHKYLSQYHAPCMEEKRHGGFFLGGKLKEYDHLSNLGIDGSNI